MAKKKKNKPQGWGTLQGRFQWLLDTLWDGSRSAMAKAIGVSVFGVIKVVTGQQEAGRRLMEAVVANTEVNPTWLLTGKGQPLLSSGIPVAQQVLPGPLADNEHMFTSQKIPPLGDLYRDSRYWLRIQRHEPIIGVADEKIKEGDLLLLETCKEEFPVRIDDLLCVVQVGKGKPPSCKLARLTRVEASDENGPAHFDADTFDAGPEMVQLTVVEEYPDGTNSLIRKKVLMKRKDQLVLGALKDGRSRPIGIASGLPIRREDILAVCVLIVRL